MRISGDRRRIADLAEAKGGTWAMPRLVSWAPLGGEGAACGPCARGSDTPTRWARAAGRDPDARRDLDTASDGHADSDSNGDAHADADPGPVHADAERDRSIGVPTPAGIDRCDGNAVADEHRDATGGHRDRYAGRCSVGRSSG